MSNPMEPSSYQEARFVVKGFSQVHGVDYTETYAPVAKTYSFRMIMAIAAARNLKILQLDVKAAFLYGTLEEEVYMQQPEGFVLPGQEGKVCRLIKSIYGLKQDSRVWNVKFNEFIISFGLKRTQCDSCIYYCHLRQGEIDKEITFFILYVDDGLILSNVNHVLLDMMEFLGKEFEIRSLPADRFIGVDINRNRSQRTIHLSQPDYIKTILQRHGQLSLRRCSSRSMRQTVTIHVPPN